MTNGDAIEWLQRNAGGVIVAVFSGHIDVYRTWRDWEDGVTWASGKTLADAVARITAEWKP